MKKLSFIFLLGMSICIQVIAQTPRFSKYQINETGYYAYFPSDPGKFEVQTSDDNLKMYLGESKVQNFKYGLIMVLFEDKFTNSTQEELLSLLESYMDYLKTSFEIKNAAGYGKGHTMDSNPNAQGMIDYWETADGTQYSVKGWIDKAALCFLYVSAKEQPDYNYQNLFLNGFRFKK